MFGKAYRWVAEMEEIAEFVAADEAAQELFIGEWNYQLVTIPPLVWNGFKGIGDGMAIVANCACSKRSASSSVGFRADAAALATASSASRRKSRG